MGGCQNYGPFLGTLNGDPKRDQNFEYQPYGEHERILVSESTGWMGVALIIVLIIVIIVQIVIIVIIIVLSEARVVSWRVPSCGCFFSGPHSR